MKLSKRLLTALIRIKFRLLAAISKKRAAEAAFRLFCTPYPRSKRKKESSLKNTESIQFELNDLKVHGNRWNYPGDKKVLLLHGFASAAHNFERYVTPLIKKGYEVVAFDAPAHGISEGRTINAVDYANMIKEANRLYGPFQSFISHSFGGLATCLALEEIPHDEKTHVVLMAPATETTSAINSAFKMLGLKDPAVRKEFDKIIMDISGRESSWFSVIRALKHLHARVLWLHDKDDDVTTHADAVKVLDHNLSHVKFVTTEGLGHRNIYRDSAVMKQVIDFL